MIVETGINRNNVDSRVIEFPALAYRTREFPDTSDQWCDLEKFTKAYDQQGADTGVARYVG